MRYAKKKDEISKRLCLEDVNCGVAYIGHYFSSGDEYAGG
jgi:hypothetical protein